MKAKFLERFPAVSDVSLMFHNSNLEVKQIILVFCLLVLRYFRQGIVLLRIRQNSFKQKMGGEFT